MKFVLFTFLFLNISSAFILFFSPVKNWVQAQIFSQDQKILSVVDGDLKNDGSYMKVIKFKTPKGIVLEFYSEPRNGGRYLVSRVEIPNAEDGFFDHRGKAVQLAVVDLDGDGRMELLAPTFDKRMRARLNPYYYSEDAEGFVPFILRNLKRRN